MPLCQLRGVLYRFHLVTLAVVVPVFPPFAAMVCPLSPISPAGYAHDQVPRWIRPALLSLPSGSCPLVRRSLGAVVVESLSCARRDPGLFSPTPHQRAFFVRSSSRLIISPEDCICSVS